jgi:hypothetical protein
MLVWGFTGGLLDRILAYGGFERPWDRRRTVPFPASASPLPGDLSSGEPR